MHSPLRVTSIAWALVCFFGCTGRIDGSSGPGLGGSGGDPGSTVTPTTWEPIVPCAPRGPTRVSRLSDRHLSNSIRDLLELPSAPSIRTSASSTEQFLPNKPAPVNGAVGLSIRELVERLSGPATEEGQARVQCGSSAPECALSFIERFASRAFRRPIVAAERDGLLAVYEAGVEGYGGHRGGIRLVIEAVLQSPSFLYVTELGDDAEQERVLTGFELAHKLSFFLYDGLPDEPLWQAAAEGRLGSPEEVEAQVERLFDRDDVKANVTRMFVRLFDLELLRSTTKADSVGEFGPELVGAMMEETERFIASTLWERDGTLRELLTSRSTFVDDRLAAIYGLEPPGSDALSPTTVPTAERAGILTHPSLLTAHALPDESSVVHRGVFILRELLCFHPPPPSPAFLAEGESIHASEPTERARAERRAALPLCRSCHGFMDPFGIAFEHYDTLGRYRRTIDTSQGSFPVDASYDFDLYDIRGPVSDGVALAEALAESRAVHECMTRQLASYALGQRLTDAQACTIGDIANEFERGGGDLRTLVRLVATWPGLARRAEVLP